MWVYPPRVCYRVGNARSLCCLLCIPADVNWLAACIIQCEYIYHVCAIAWEMLGHSVFRCCLQSAWILHRVLRKCAPFHNMLNTGLSEWKQTVISLLSYWLDVMVFSQKMPEKHVSCTLQETVRRLGLALENIDHTPVIFTSQGHRETKCTSSAEAYSRRNDYQFVLILLVTTVQKWLKYSQDLTRDAPITHNRADNRYLLSDYRLFCG